MVAKGSLVKVDYEAWTEDGEIDRVIRGGAWNGAYTSWVRPTFRYKNAPDTRSHGIGFRCALSL